MTCSFFLVILEENSTEHCRTKSLIRMATEIDICTENIDRYAVDSYKNIFHFVSLLARKIFANVNFDSADRDSR